MKNVLYIVVAFTLCACHFQKRDWDMSGQDTVPAAQFAPQPDSIRKIDLAAITGLNFPKYKITNEQPLAIGNDSLAVSEDEESIANGNCRWPGMLWHSRAEQ